MNKAAFCLVDSSLAPVKAYRSITARAVYFHYCKKRRLSSQANPAGESPDSQPSNQSNGAARIKPTALQARRKQEDKEFFADLLRSAVTKRDAKAYISRLKSLRDPYSRSGSKAQQIPKDLAQRKSAPDVNLGGFFSQARAMGQSPVFKQHTNSEEAEIQQETTHVALVKIIRPELLDDAVLQGIGKTLAQLSRLSMSPCVVVDSNAFPNATEIARRQHLLQQANRVVNAICAQGDPGAIRLDNCLEITHPHGPCNVTTRKRLLQPLQRGRIPVVAPLAYSSLTQKISEISGNEAVLALTRELAGLNLKALPDHSPNAAPQRQKALQHQVSLDRLIILDQTGGIPFSGRPGHNHVFINLEQEGAQIRKDLEASSQVVEIIELLQNVLSILPPTSSALVTAPTEAARSSDSSSHALSVSSVGTRRQRNPLIHNLLTDKPSRSSSLPMRRLGMNDAAPQAPFISESTFVKRGMPLTILPEPSWTAQSRNTKLKLTDTRIDLPRLVHLINDSFDRKLNVEHYLRRVDDNLAGIIVAGEYEGGAIFTWEMPDGLLNDESSPRRLVPYLDKFAVLKRSQGAGGVADILFNAMVRTCFPDGVCWRSRRNNPVNKWYFERARGTWKMPDTNWTMFWTTEGVVEHDQTFKDYESVCRGVQPSWADNKQVID